MGISGSPGSAAKPARRRKRKSGASPHPSGPLLSEWPSAMTDAVVADAARVSALPSLKTSSGERPWEAWHQLALVEGVGEELAALGREVMREALVCRWREEMRIACGSLDEGRGMIELARNHPEHAEQMWSHLLETNGETLLTSDDAV